MYAYVMLEVRRTLRDGAFLIFGTGMPVLMYLLFTNIGDTSGAVRAPTTGGRTR